MIFVKTGRVEESAVGEELVLLDIDAGLFKSLTHVALFIWRTLDETGDVTEIKRRVAARYTVSEAILDDEVGAFLDELEAAGFVRRRAA